jgi:hypothetical protein
LVLVRRITGMSGYTVLGMFLASLVVNVALLVLGVDKVVLASVNAFSLTALGIVASNIGKRNKNDDIG